MNVLSLFSGVGGLDLGLERAGMTVVGQVEIDSWCRKVLAKHWPEVPRHDDVRTAVEWWGDRPVDLVAGGPPCQPVSVAGLKGGEADPRWQWPAMARVIEATQPAWVIVENVPGLRTRGLAAIRRDLAGLGYRTRPGLISACEMGATHPRRRLFTLAHAKGVRCGQRRPGRPDLDAPARARQQAPVLAHANGLRAVPAGRGWWDTEPGVARMVDGLPDRVDRTRGLGNAVVPQVAEHIGRMIMEAAA